MVLLGIDFGNSEIRVSEGDSISDIVKKLNLLKIDNVISFCEKCRLYGTNAKKNLYNEFGPNTFISMKWLLGKHIDNKQLNEFIDYCQIFKEQFYLNYNNNNISYSNDELILNHLNENDNRLYLSTSNKLKYFNLVHNFYPEDILSMILTNLKNQINASLYIDSDEEQITCVISVPLYYTSIERNLFLSCCRNADLDCIALCNDTTAICLYYVVTKRNLLTSTPKLLIIIDCGDISLQIAYAVVWDSGIKMVHSHYVENFGGKMFDYKLYEKLITNDAFKSLNKSYSPSQLKALILRECEKAKTFDINTAFEMRLTRDFSFILYKEDFEQACSDLFFLFAKHLRSSYADFSKRFNMPSSDPTKSEAINILLCGSTMKISKLNETVKHVFNMEGKQMTKDIVSKGCMLMADIIANKKKDIAIIDCISHDLCVQGVSSISTLIAQNSAIPTKLLVRNVQYSPKYTILINRDIEFATVTLKLSDRKKKSATSLNISWKLLINNNGIIEKITPVCTKIDESGKEVVDAYAFSFELSFKVMNTTDNEHKLYKKLKTFERLENYEQDDNPERFQLQNFIFQSIDFLSQISRYLAEENKIELLKLLEDEEKWLLCDDIFNSKVCLAKLDVLQKRIELVRKQKTTYDECLEKLAQYQELMDENEKVAQTHHYSYLNNPNSKSGFSLDEFQYRMFLKLMEDHRKFYQRFSENISHGNILDIIISSDLIQDKIDNFRKESDEILRLNQSKTEHIIEHSYDQLVANTVEDQEPINESMQETEVNYNKLKHVTVKKQNLEEPKELPSMKINEHSEHESGEDDDYQTLDINTRRETTKYAILIKKKNNTTTTESDNENDTIDDNQTERNSQVAQKLRKTPSMKPLTIKGTEILTRGTAFGLRLQSQSFKHIAFPTLWDLGIRLDKKEFRVMIEPDSTEFELVKEKFKPMTDTNHTLLYVWRIQNENLWANFYMKKHKMKAINELELFYGCDGAYFKHVCENNCQYRRSTYKCPDFGLGVYFYKSILDAHRNVKPYYGCYYMFVCRVAVGRTKLGTPNTSKLEKGYQTSTNRKYFYNSTIFVVPKGNSDQIYPFYLLAYQTN